MVRHAHGIRRSTLIGQLHHSASGHRESNGAKFQILCDLFRTPVWKRRMSEQGPARRSGIREMCFVTPAISLVDMGDGSYGVLRRPSRPTLRILLVSPRGSWEGQSENQKQHTHSVPTHATTMDWRERLAGAKSKPDWRVVMGHSVASPDRLRLSRLFVWEFVSIHVAGK